MIDMRRALLKAGASVISILAAGPSLSAKGLSVRAVLEYKESGRLLRISSTPVTLRVIKKSASELVFDDTKVSDTIAAEIGSAQCQAVGGTTRVKLRLRDHDANLVDTQTETVNAQLRVGEQLIELQLLETSADSGTFEVVIPAATLCDDTKRQLISASYVDPRDPSDRSDAVLMGQGGGRVFDAATGAPVDGVRVSLIDAATGLPATVFGYDGRSRFPPAVTSGQDSRDDGGRGYPVPSGGWTFPRVPPGVYRIEVADTEGPISLVRAGASAIATKITGGAAPRLTAASSGAPFTVTTPGSLAFDLAVSRGDTPLTLESTLSSEIASAGDAIEHRIIIVNRSKARSISLSGLDVDLARGLSLIEGSARAFGTQLAVGGYDGRKFAIALPSLAAGQKLEVTFVTRVNPDAQTEDATTTVTALLVGGRRTSSTTSIIRYRDAFLADKITIIGRVLKSGCDKIAASEAGAAGIKVRLADGRYAITDEFGRYHFEQQRPGLNVVQIDIPAGSRLRAVSCERNTRFAGSASSQFIDAQGGSLWRADFYIEDVPEAPASPPPPILELPPPPPAVETPPAPVVVFFDWDESKITPESATMLDEAARVFAASGSISIVIAGHTDSSGTDRYNEKLSQQRAAAVRTHLLGRGVPATALALEAFGERRPRISTGDDVREPQNRRVELAFAKPATLVSVAGPPPPLRVPSVGAIADALPAGVASAKLTSNGARPTPSPFSAERASDVEAAGGGEVDWLKDQIPGIEWRFPGPRHNPRAPAQRVVIKHMPGQLVELLVNKEPVDKVRSEGSITDRRRSLAVSVWRGVPLREGANLLEARILTADGKLIKSIRQTVVFSSTPSRIAYIPELSNNVADGATRPVIAIRLTDALGHPVRDGVTGSFDVSPPHRAYSDVEAERVKILAGRERFQATYQVRGDDGIALVELAPTTQSGRVEIGVDVSRRAKRRSVFAWLEAGQGDWALVGFGSVTLGLGGARRHIEPLSARAGDRVYVNGQATFFARGRIKGKWLLTLSGDSERQGDRNRRSSSLFGAVERNKYYTIYGDRTLQGDEAPSSDRLYVKLERPRFQTIYGDYDTNFNETRLGRYSRTFTGVRAEYRDPRLALVGFAANSSQRYARDELQGNGLSGPYSLTRTDILTNSDRIRIETRDRLRSNVILDAKSLIRDVDYEIDVDTGTIRFREPIANRDFDLNPVFIVAEYETLGRGKRDISAGARSTLQVLDDKVQLGATLISEGGFLGRTSLAGLDVKFAPNDTVEVRGEAAISDGDRAGRAEAYAFEIDHRGNILDARAYYHRQATGFGLGQQNGVETGTEKFGIDARVRLDHRLSLTGTAYRETYAVGGGVREVADARLVFRERQLTASLGLQTASESSALAAQRSSQQVNLRASRSFPKRELELYTENAITLKKSGQNDFPSRFLVGGRIRVLQSARLVGSYEYSDASEYKATTGRIGIEVSPWKGASVSTSINQQSIEENGTRAFAGLGARQSLMLSKRWSADVAFESNNTFSGEPTTAALSTRLQPPAVGGSLSSGAVFEDFWSLSTGATYRAPTTSATARIEFRNGSLGDRLNATAGLIHQLRSGVSVASSAQFSAIEREGVKSSIGRLDLSAAIRPDGAKWSALNLLELRHDAVRGGVAGQPTVFGVGSLLAKGRADSWRVVNNLSVNLKDLDAAMFRRQIELQVALFYGAKYVTSRFESGDFSGFTHMLGVDARIDLNSSLDVGIQGSVRHSWRGAVSYAAGPSIGYSPDKNMWLSLGYNVVGFSDRDFERTRYSRSGPFVSLRFKLDSDSAHQLSRVSASDPR